MPHSVAAANARKTSDPLPWNDYFNRELYLKHQRSGATITHHVYVLSPTGKGPLIVCHHGAGSSGLSFALFALEIRKLLPNCGVLSLDAREHGETKVEDPRVEDGLRVMDLTLPTLSEDLFDVIRLTQEEMKWAHSTDLILIGHSLGGAVVTELAKCMKLHEHLLGYAVLDVVEGSAIDALQSMQQYLQRRPSSFPSISSAIEWQ